MGDKAQLETLETTTRLGTQGGLRPTRALIKNHLALGPACSDDGASPIVK